MKLTAEQIKTLEPCIVNATLTGKKVNVICSGISSGKRALLVLRSAYNPKSVEVLSGTERIAVVNFAQFLVYLYRYRDFTLVFNTEAEAAACASDLSQVISKAVEDGVEGQGINGAGNLGLNLWGNGRNSNIGSGFFKSNFFYALCGIAVVIILATAGVLLMKNSKK